MARGYRRLTLADEDEIWMRLRAGHAAKPTARGLGLTTGGVRASAASPSDPANHCIAVTGSAAGAAGFQTFPQHGSGPKGWRRCRG